jgi:hypothetical protein
MSNTRQLVKFLLVGMAIASLAGCVVRPQLVGAHVKKAADKTELVEVVLPAGDAKRIKDREIYFSIVVVDCKNYENRFPVEPYIAGRLASKFDFPVEGEFVTAQGSMPDHILAGFPTPCVALQGGSYIFGKLDSTPVSLVRLGK